MAAPARQGPPRWIRYFGRSINAVATHAPWAWPIVSRTVGRFFDRAAPGWDERIQPDSSEHLAGIERGLAMLEATPARCLDVGTGTGSVALMLAERYPGAEVLGIDVSQQMIDRARAKAERSGSPARFELVDVSNLDAPRRFDLITMLNMPPFFDRLADLLEPGGYVVHASSAGARTPFYTSERELRRGFARRGLETVEAGSTGAATFFVGRRPPE
jgi:2-polyprenyl-3-methyl-5-hydroxy-6-metoxy-1,4-benzoquinol methylase